MTTHANLTYNEALDVVYSAPNGAQVVYSSGDIAWGITSTALVIFMTYGVGWFYSGLLRRSSALSAQLTITAIFACVTIEWLVFGYSLSFSPGNGFIGSFRYIGLRDVMAEMADGLPHSSRLLQALYQLSFAVITPVIAFGANAERGSIGGCLVLSVLWALIVYNPIAHAIWHPNGFLAKLGNLDFAGGGPVHMNSGIAALYYLGHRQGYGKTLGQAYRPASVSFVSLGTIMIVVGWLGFNGGSAGGANMGAIQATINTIIASQAGGLTWLLLDYRLQRKFSMIALCSGIVSGLVAVTPAAGYVAMPSALAIGVLGTAFANVCTRFKYFFKIDETLDIFAVHWAAGFAGSIFTGVFADAPYSALNGLTVINGGWVSHHWIQVAYQLASAAFVTGYSGATTLILCALVDLIPGLRMRISPDEEALGMDQTQIGEAFLDLEGLGPASRTSMISELSLQQPVPSQINFHQYMEGIAEQKPNRGMSG